MVLLSVIHLKFKAEDLLLSAGLVNAVANFSLGSEVVILYKNSNSKMT